MPKGPTRRLSVPTIEAENILSSDRTGSWSPSIIYNLKDDSDYEEVAEGPYFLVGDELHEAWRLYPDYLDSFMTTVVPDVDKSGA